MKKLIIIISAVLALVMTVGLLSAFTSGVSGVASPGKDTSADFIPDGTEEDPSTPDNPSDTEGGGDGTEAPDISDTEPDTVPDTEPEPEADPKVTAPTVTINAEQNIIITGTEPAATSYQIYVDSVPKITITETMYKIWDLDLKPGTYQIGVVAKADGYLDSDMVTVSYTITGYKVTFTDTTYGSSSETTEETSATLRVFYSKNTYTDITLNKNTNLSTIYSGVVAVQLQSDTTSKYLYYGMGELTSYLYHQGSGYSSERLHLVNDLNIHVAVQYQECISADSLVLMANGKYKKLGEIKTGDYVLSYDWETMQLVPNKVIYASSEEENWDSGAWDAVRYIKHTFSDGTVIKQAFAHRFYNLEAKAFVYLEHWNVGDHTYDQDGDNPYLVKSEVVYETIRYARITLENGTNYFANGLLTGDRHCPSGISLGGESE